MGSGRFRIPACAAFAAISLCEPRPAMAADGDRPSERFVSVSATGSVNRNCNVRRTFGSWLLISCFP